MLDTIRDMLEREPFQPFHIVLTSGERYDVTDPHLVAWGRTQITVYTSRSDRFAILRVSQITAVEAREAAA